MQETNGLVLFLLCFLGACLLLGLFWLNHYLRTGGESVNSSERVTSSQEPAQRQTDQTDGADRPSVSAHDLACGRLQLDRTKQAIIEVMVYNGWGTGEIRTLLKGDNGATGAEVDAARKKLGIDPPERMLRVRDGKEERVITM